MGLSIGARLSTSPRMATFFIGTSPALAFVYDYC